MDKKFNAQWIWDKDIPENHRANTWMLFRKNITLEKKPQKAETWIAADSKYWLYINGNLVIFEGGLKRGPTRNDIYADRIDIAKYLTTGENIIAVQVVFFGVRKGMDDERAPESYSDNSSGKGGFFFEAHIDGKKIVSDKSWRVIRHGGYIEPVTFPNYRLPETDLNYDASLSYEFENWYKADYDDTLWNSAAELGIPPCSPWNDLWERPIPIWKDSGIVISDDKHIKIESIDGGQKYTVSLPANLQFTPYFKVNAKNTGSVIKISTSNNKITHSSRAQHITKTGEQEYESLLWLSGWKIIFEFPEGVTPLAVGYRATGYDTEFAGSFISDDEWLNKLWIKSRDTLYVTMRDGFMDCPDRERASWWGDAVIESEMAYYALDKNAHLLIKKGISNVKEWSRDNIRVTVPVCREWFELPVQSLAGIMGDWQHYMYTGDKSVLELTYCLNRDYLLNAFTMNGDGLVNHRQGSWDWSDWGENADQYLITNAWYYIALECVVKTAKIIKNDEDLGGLLLRIQSIKDNFDRVFWQGTEYRSPDMETADDRANALAVFSGLADKRKYPVIRKVLTEKKFASPYMEKYVLEALFMMGYAVDAVMRMKERYSEMVNSDIPTLWEYFSLNGGSANHAWSGGPLTLMSKYIAGVSPIEAGYDRFLVKPQTADIKRINAVVPTVKGNIEVNIEKRKITVTVPKNTTAVIALPIKYENIQMGGRMKQDNAGVRFIQNHNGYSHFEAESGKWEFEW